MSNPFQLFHFSVTENACEKNNGGCSYLCVKAPHRSEHSAKTSCKCPPDLELMDDLKTCAGHTPHPSLATTPAPTKNPNAPHKASAGPNPTGVTATSNHSQRTLIAAIVIGIIFFVIIIIAIAVFVLWR